MQRRIKLFIATSLDGYIAGPNGEIDWLFSDQDYSYSEFIAGIDTIIMGRRSYETALTFDEWRYTGLRAYVFSHDKDHAPDPRVTFVNRPVVDLVSEIRRTAGKDIWLLGGGELIRSFLDAGLVDDVTIAIHPVFLGAGIPLIPVGTRQTAMRLMGERRYDTGLLLITYTVQH